MLMNMGYAKVVAEKALYLTKDKGIEEAMIWLDQNCENQDFHDEFFIYEAPPKPKPKTLKLNTTV
jgi:uncharacterized UBP type Zn finger protein